MSQSSAGSSNAGEGSEYTRLNLGKVKKNACIYRFFRKDWFYALFSKSENILVSPSNWRDPFENVILKSPVRMASGEIGTFTFQKDLYGQCWTLHTASDAMWRIYSPKKNAIRVRTSIDKLARSLSATLGQWAHDQSFIGKVDYLSERKLKDFAATVFEHGVIPAAIARSILVKRLAFVHEREVRLIYFEKDSTKYPHGLYRYAIDPHALIDQIMIDPRLTKSEADIFKKEIREKTNFKGEIKRSLLYAPPKGFVVKIF